MSGVLAQENVNIANTMVPGQYFGAVNSESDDFYSNPNSGVIGERSPARLKTNDSQC